MAMKKTVAKKLGKKTMKKTKGGIGCEPAVVKASGPKSNPLNRDLNLGAEENGW